jgi:hypothetical protein
MVELLINIFYAEDYVEVLEGAQAWNSKPVPGTAPVAAAVSPGFQPGGLM